MRFFPTNGWEGGGWVGPHMMSGKVVIRRVERSPQGEWKGPHKAIEKVHRRCVN